MTDPTPTHYHAASGFVFRDADVKITPAPAGYVGYPRQEHHNWGEFAGLAIEFGGHGDLSAIDPQTGMRITLLIAFSPDSDDNIPSFTDALRRLVDAMEATDFLAQCAQMSPNVHQDGQ